MSEIFEVRIRSGESLKGWFWPAENAVTNLTIITGMNEYARRYEPFAQWMNGHHINVWCLDAFGQGLNAPSADFLERWPQGAFDKTVKALMQMVKLASSNGLPTFLMGHSMGSFIVQAFLEKYPMSTSGIILCGSNGGQRRLMKTGYNLAKGLVQDRNWYQSNPTLQNLGMGSFAKAVKDRETEFDWLSPAITGRVTEVLKLLVGDESVNIRIAESSEADDTYVSLSALKAQLSTPLIDGEQR